MGAGHSGNTRAPEKRTPERGNGALREVSPLLGSRSGLSTAEESMAKVAAKLAELVALEEQPAVDGHPAKV